MSRLPVLPAPYEAAASVVLDNTGTLREAADKAAALLQPAYPGAEDSHSPQLPVYAGALCERDRHHCGR